MLVLKMDGDRSKKVESDYPAAIMKITKKEAIVLFFGNIWFTYMAYEYWHSIGLQIWGLFQCCFWFWILIRKKYKNNPKPNDSSEESKPG